MMVKLRTGRSQLKYASEVDSLSPHTCRCCPSPQKTLISQFGKFLRTASINRFRSPISSHRRNSNQREPEMLAVFSNLVAKSPEELNSPSQSGASASSSLKDNLLLRHFDSLNPDAVSVNLGPSGFIAFSSDRQNPILPRLFAAVDDIFCLFQGHIENMSHLKQQYGLTKAANEVSIIIEAYRSLRDRGPNPADLALRNIEGKFAFIVYDSSSNCTFIAVDADGSVPLFWGSDSEYNLVLSDDVELVKKTCGRSLAPFPKGCFFTSSGGLKSFEHPRKELKPVPWKDSSGQSYGATFIVDADSKKEGVNPGMPRVGSDADWASRF